MQRRLQAADRAAHAQAAVLRQPGLPLHLRKLALTAVVQPVLTFAAQVWSRPTQAARARLDSWQMAHAARMAGCPPSASHRCLQQELGLTPLHVTCECLALRYWHHLRALPAGCLLRRVAEAWGGAANPGARSGRAARAAPALQRKRLPTFSSNALRLAAPPAWLPCWLP